MCGPGSWLDVVHLTLDNCIIRYRSDKRLVRHTKVQFYWHQICACRFSLAGAFFRKYTRNTLGRVNFTSMEGMASVTGGLVDGMKITLPAPRTAGGRGC
jgi:hypothetical protein